ncbi:hypothetical protein [Streptomyces sp. AM8-1-1]|uniref:hypothetical protein n=1 Tax=Streptomyces sp. AM8-1-1 TaxID=3075825 RepID=UPI0028C45665|nr:hypothetical protein [Streptomyces sp. AM8-1-1]WNO76379.1 hypothetical protein RPQ07_34275 [Streptomyces sp. AM8-1-1]
MAYEKEKVPAPKRIGTPDPLETEKPAASRARPESGEPLEPAKPVDSGRPVEPREPAGPATFVEPAAATGTREPARPVAADTDATAPRIGTTDVPRTPESHDTPVPHSAPAGPAHSEPQEHKTSGHLIAQDEREKLARRLRDSLSGFVDAPRHAVEDAAAVMDDAAQKITTALTEQRRALRADWHGEGKGGSREADTEDLRLALRSYREMTERLLRL